MADAEADERTEEERGLGFSAKSTTRSSINSKSQYSTGRQAEVW